MFEMHNQLSFFMNVKEVTPISSNHSIEWGEATWDGSDFSIRNRYNTDEGRFNRTGSSEIPWSDFLLMVKESIGKNMFSHAEVAEILDAISQRVAKIN